MTALLDWLTAHRRAALTIVAAALVLVAGAVTVRSSHPAAPPRGTASARTPVVASGPVPDPTAPAGNSTRGPQSLGAADHDALTATLARLGALTPVHPGTSRAHPLISGQAVQQPDLYAAALVRALLTQDYRTPRADLLAWVQAESAPTAEPTVVGLIPAQLRPQLAVASVQEGFDGPGPVPAPGVWDALATQHAHTTVVIGQVSEPVTWSAALATGQISDPGVTARQVDAQVTLHRTVGAHQASSTSSVAVTVNLEGPPVRARYGLVAVVTYLVRAGQS